MPSRTFTAPMAHTLAARRMVRRRLHGGDMRSHFHPALADGACARLARQSPAMKDFIAIDVETANEQPSSVCAILTQAFPGECCDVPRQGYRAIFPACQGRIRGMLPLCNGCRTPRCGLPWEVLRTIPPTRPIRRRKRERSMYRRRRLNATTTRSTTPLPAPS